VSDSGVEGNGGSTEASISGDGRFVAFQTSATNLEPGDPQGNDDFGADHILVYDRDNDTVERVSQSDSGEPGNSTTQFPDISSDGRYVVFESDSDNLVNDDSNELSDIFVFDRDNDTIERVSVDSAGAESDGPSNSPTISANGRFVAFHSLAGNLVSGDNNDVQDIFVYDRDTDNIERVSVDSSGVEVNERNISARIADDGRYVVFESDSDNLVSGDNNGERDIFVHDRNNDSIERVSVDSGGGEGNDNSFSATITPQGRFVAFESDASNLVANDTNSSTDVFLHDRSTGTTELVSLTDSGAQGNDGSFNPSLSADGRYVGFGSGATNLVPGDTNGFTDLFLYDRNNGRVVRISRNAGGAGGDQESRQISLSSDARFAAFHSTATNLVTNDTNRTQDVFVVAHPFLR